ncbi:indolepyruvate ferredoxin oxidoreductase family protein [Jatrophihabitans sp. DSM 45814]
MTSPSPCPELPRADYDLDKRYLTDPGTIHLTGIQALVRMILERQRYDHRSGHRSAAYVSGYEGSPLAGLDLELSRQSRLLVDHQVVHVPALNEELAATAVSGTQLAATVATLKTAGISSFWYGKAPGLDRATDALRHANLIGTAAAGGAVAFVGDDPGAKSSSVPCSSEYALADLLMPTLAPADPSEIIHFGLHAVELSRASGLWSAVKVATAVADGSRTFAPSPWQRADMTGVRAAYSHQPSARLLGAELMNLERSQILIRLPTAVEYIRRSGLNVVSGDSTATIGIVASGKTYLDVISALDLLGLEPRHPERYGLRLLKLGAVYPLDPEQMLAFARGLTEIVVVEDKRPFIEDAIKSALYGRAGAPTISGKRSPDGRTLFTPVNELDPVSAAVGLSARISAHLDLPSVQAFTPSAVRQRTTLHIAERREPYFCSGCPHNSSTRASAGTLVGGGIGCHAMVLFMSPEQVGDVTGLSQMGGEGAQWIGMAPFVAQQHFIQNLGDGTFAHSGSLAIRAAVASGVNITYRLLRNSAVAMTGGQDVVGELPLPHLVSLLQSEGVAQIIVTSDEPKRIRRGLPRSVEVRHRDESAAVQKRLEAVTGVSVLIHDQECAAEKRRKRRRGTAETPNRRIVINERLCEGCGDCGRKSNCLSVQPVNTDFGRKTRIDQSTCNLDYSCLTGDCPSFLAVDVPSAPRKHKRVPRSVPATAPLPDPVSRCGDPNRIRVRIAGVGGTGVVTVAQILATASLLDGKFAHGLDQTGLAQKGGAVISDLTITADGEPRAARLIDGGADLYLGCDSLVAADPTYLRAASPDHTTAVVSTSEVPTGRMVTNTSVQFPIMHKLGSAIDAACARTIYLNAFELAVHHLGSEQYANMIVVGAAYQAGTLPLTVAAIQRAVELNGIEVEANLRAFDLGRAQLISSEATTQAAQSSVDPGTASAATETAAALVAAHTGLGTADPAYATVLRRVLELIAYQNTAYARRYLTDVEGVRAVEAPLNSELSLTDTVATALYTLMAYKDEYEVARLSLRSELRSELAEEFGPDARVSYQLHPPLLRALGLQRKVSLGPWFDPIFRTLYAARRLRGSIFDPFGATVVRRTERRLIEEYRKLIHQLLRELTAESLTGAVEIAGLATMIRGYEEIKMNNIDRYHAALAEALTQRPSTIPDSLDGAAR